MGLTVDQRTAAIKAAADIVIALIANSPAFKMVDDDARKGRMAATAFATVYQQIQQSATSKE